MDAWKASRKFTLLLIIFLPGVCAAEVFKCQINGSTVYRPHPCKGEVGQFLQQKHQKKFSEDGFSKPGISVIARFRGEPSAHINELLKGLEQKPTLLSSHIENHCNNSSKTRGALDMDKYLYCVEQQNKSVESIYEFMDINRSEFFYSHAMLHCWGKWGESEVINPRKLNHCLSGESVGWNRFHEYKNKYDIDVVSELAAEGLKKYLSWKMVAAHIRQGVEQ